MLANLSSTRDLLVENNPYKTPTNLPPARPSPSQWRLAELGFLLSLTGVTALSTMGMLGESVGKIATYLTFSSLPGLIISVIALRWAPRRVAAWGVGLGILGTLYLPTLLLSLR